MRICLVVLLCAFTLGCANRSLNDVKEADASQAYKVKFGTIIDQRRVNIRSGVQPSVAGGALAGSVAGAVAGGNSAVWLISAAAGGLSGMGLHHYFETDNGTEYTISFNDGSTQVIDQLHGAGDPVLPNGSAVMVQFGARINRVLPAAHLPDQVSPPKQVKVKGRSAPAGRLDVRTCQKGPADDTSKESCTQY
ncbi:MAG: hypothetical protein EBS72_08830 [Rhizobiales bacterium]|nr:hypothetical protein [Hyphomicrobiales bacterium]